MAWFHRLRTWLFPPLKEPHLPARVGLGVLSPRAIWVTVLVGFLVAGTLNGYLISVLLTSGRDVLNSTHSQLSVSTVLTAVVLATVTSKIVSLALVSVLPYWLLIACSAMFGVVGLLMIVFMGETAGKIAGGCILAMQQATGEVMWVAYSGLVRGAPVVVAWSIGSGVSGILGSGVYFVLTTFAGVAPLHALLLNLWIPVTMLLVYLYPLRLARQPTEGVEEHEAHSRSADHADSADTIARPVAVPSSFRLPGIETSKQFETRLVPDGELYTASSSLAHTTSGHRTPPAPQPLDGPFPDPDPDSDPEGPARGFDAAAPPRESRSLSGGAGKAGIAPLGEADAPDSTKLTAKGRLAILAKLFLPVLLPLFLVYLAEYLSLTAFGPLIVFVPAPINPAAQYRLWSALYQTGVLIARSGGAFFVLRWMWIPASLQFFTFLFILAHLLFDLVPSFWVMCALYTWVGMLGGTAYVGALVSLHRDGPACAGTSFSLAATTLSEVLGILAAGIIGSVITPWLRAHVGLG